MKFSLPMATAAIASGLAFCTPGRALAEDPMRLPRLTGPVVLDRALSRRRSRGRASP
ncbi:hypothetical protein WME99_36685 [Sorangium sp. So ce136]|uniref:hypothetical protein n=1 Tax=Sorangium sp. So ce136 TaxID=3133284 RepID=UPI003F0E8CB2